MVVNVGPLAGALGHRLHYGKIILHLNGVQVLHSESITTAHNSTGVVRLKQVLHYSTHPGGAPVEHDFKALTSSLTQVGLEQGEAVIARNAFRR